MGNLLLIFVRPLTRHLHGHPPLVINITQPGFGLQVGMFLAGPSLFPRRIPYWGDDNSPH